VEDAAVAPAILSPVVFSGGNVTGDKGVPPISVYLRIAFLKPTRYAVGI